MIALINYSENTPTIASKSAHVSSHVDANTIIEMVIASDMLKIELLGFSRRCVVASNLAPFKSICKYNYGKCTNFLQYCQIRMFYI